MYPAVKRTNLLDYMHITEQILERFYLVLVSFNKKI